MAPPTPRPDGFNFGAVLAHHPALAAGFRSLTSVFREPLLPRRIRELVILRVAWRAQAVYAFGHHRVFGRKSGLSDNEIYATTRALSETLLTEGDRLVLQVADELCDDNCITDATWARVRAHYDDPEVLELLFLVGLYRMFAGVVNSLGIELDQGIPGWLA
jgi:alkylhydroperoxidase family enzyme